MPEEVRRRVRKVFNSSLLRNVPEVFIPLGRFQRSCNNYRLLLYFIKILAINQHEVEEKLYMFFIKSKKYTAGKIVHHGDRFLQQP